MATEAAAGPSVARGERRRKRKGVAPSAKTDKSRKVTEKQKIAALNVAVQEFNAPPGLKLFTDLPISEQTKRGLKKAWFTEMTDIQAKSLPTSLKGSDLLGAARTGSGKTLAFLVPVLELLYRNKWGPQDGLGALIISPTRELAVQIFEVLRKIGGYHTFSAGLVIGGKNLKDESDRLARMNILVATPGRLLQHMDQTVGFACDGVQLLVLDEADRILDMGFSRTLSALLSHLPKTRQTLLFSATQTQSVKDLARLSLTDPVSVSTQPRPSSTAPSDPSTSTSASDLPSNLAHHYVLCALDQKLNLLFSFIKSHLQSKTLVFLSSCKQVRFVFETFRTLHPGVPLLHLHGKQKQQTRLATYDKFARAKTAVLFATDIAARGLDFPKVDWVVQLDAPEDAETYVHRVGRTARYESKGQAMLVLCPSEEEGVVATLKAKGIEVGKIKVKASKTQRIENMLQNLAFKDPEIKYLGQRACVSYLRSVHLQKNKDIFKLEELPIEAFAASLGLPGVPKIKFLGKEIAKARKNAAHDMLEEPSKPAPISAMDSDSASEAEKSEEDADVHSSSEEDELPSAPAVKGGVRTKYDRMFERKNQNVLSEHYHKLVSRDREHGTDSESDEDFITLKRADHGLSDDERPASVQLSKRKLKMGQSKSAMLKYRPAAERLVFDDDGVGHKEYEMKTGEEFVREAGGEEGVREAGRKFAVGEREKVVVADVRDREEAKAKRKEKKRKRKERERQAEDMSDDEGEGGVAQLAPPLAVDDDGYVSPDFDLPSESGEDAPMAARKPKRQKTSKSSGTVEDDEMLALQMLRAGR